VEAFAGFLAFLVFAVLSFLALVVVVVVDLSVELVPWAIAKLAPNITVTTNISSFFMFLLHRERVRVAA
jgi:hypothetical protein